MKASFIAKLKVFTLFSMGLLATEIIRRPESGKELSYLGVVLFTFWLLLEVKWHQTPQGRNGDELWESHLNG